jgi:hypothetical protein
MFKTLLLICALETPQAECSMTTAEAVIQGPDATSLVQCGLHGQAYIAHGAIAGYLDGAHYLKITCTAGQRLPGTPLEPIQSAGRPPSTAPTTD